MVNLKPNGEIKDFRPKQLLITNIRVPSWPLIFQDYLVNATPDTFLMITNPVGLVYILQDLLEWFNSLVAIFIQSNEDDKKRMAVEAGIFNYISNKARQEKSFTQIG